MSRALGRLAAVLLSSLVPATLAHAQDGASPRRGSPSEPDIVVTPFRTAQPIQRAGSAITVITAEEIEKASARDVSDLFRRVPGVTLTQSGGPGHVQTVRIRGGDVRHTLVLIDGIRVNDPTSTGREFDFSTLVLADIERIEVLRGPQSALYGSDAMGGVINIITKRGSGPPRANLSAEAGRYGTKEAKGGLSGGDGTVDYSFGFAGFDTAGFSTFGYRIPRLRFAVPWGLEPDHAKRFGLNGRVGVNMTDGVRLEFGGSTSFNRAQFDGFFDPAFSPFPDTPSRSRSWLHNVYSRLIADSFDGAFRSTVTTYANRTDRAFENVSYGRLGVFCGSTFFVGPAVTSCRQDTFFIGDRKGVEYQGDVKMGPLGLFTFGAKAEQDQADSFSQIVLPSPAPRLRDIAAEQVTRSAFALHQITLFERLHLSLGGRVDNVREVDTFETWRATAAYEMPETETKLRASAGTGAKAPSLFQLFSPEFGTTTLQPEHSFGVDAGIDQMLFDGRVKVSGTVFWNRYRNLIDFKSPDFSVFPVVPIGCRPTQVFGCYFNVARARTSGAELAAEFSIVPQFVRVRVTYTALEAVDLITHVKLARRPGHEGRFGLIITPIPGLTIEPTVVYVGHRYDRPFDPTLPNPIQAFARGKLQPYARFDLYAEYRLNETFSIYARGENLTNARYEEVMNFGTAGRSVYGGVRATW
jgi:vitamin B12 transporter